MPRIDIELLEEEWDDDFRPPPGKKYSVAAQQRIDDDDVGRVVAVDRGRVTALVDGEVLEASYGGSMRGTKVVVGDRVRVRGVRHDGDTPRVTERLDRETTGLYRGIGVLFRTPASDGQILFALPGSPADRA